MRIVPIIIALVVAFSTGAHAQNPADILPPKAPFVAPVPTNADWTVTLQYPLATDPSAAKTDGRMTEVHSTKTGAIKRDRISYAGKPSQDFWFANTLGMRTDSQGEVSVTDLNSSVAAEATDPNPSVATGYPGVKWLTMDRYDKVLMRDKRAYYHFIFGKNEAWIDAETHLPFVYLSDGIAFRFTFNPPPDAPLVLPPAFLKAYEFCQGAIDRRKKVASELARKR